MMIRSIKIIRASIAFLLFTSIIICYGEKVEYYVSPMGDDNNPGTLSQPFKTIGKASDVISTKTSSSITLYLVPSQYSINYYSVFSNQQSVTIKTTQEGVKASINCTSYSNSPIFQIYNLNSFEIHDLIVENCESDVIYYKPSTTTQTLSIYNSEFRNNDKHIVYTHGVVKLITIDNNIFENNKKQIIFNRFVNEKENFLQTAETSLTVTNSIVNGGSYAFYLHFMNKITMQNCIFQNIVNTVIFYDISPQQKNYENLLTISNCTFSDCQTKSTYAAAIYIAYLATTELVVGDISKNSLSISNSKFENLSALSGGSIYMQNIKATLNNVIFQNSTSNYNGGAIEANSCYLEIKDSTFSSNSAIQGDGGSIDLSMGSQLYCDNCKFNDNFAIDGSSIACYSDSEFVVMVSDCTFENNEFLENFDVSCNQSTITYSWLFWFFLVSGFTLMIGATIAFVIIFAKKIRAYRASSLNSYSNPHLETLTDNNLEIEMEENPSNVE